jgi:predicted glycosyltransferase
MKRIMFYCQYLTGMGHLVRSTEIIRSLVKDFQVCFVNGGPLVEGFEIPAGVELVTLPPLWIENGELQVTEGFSSLEEVKLARKKCLISTFNRLQADCLITEFFPFGRHKLAFELVPLLEHIKKTSPQTKIVSSVRDIVGRSDLEQEEATIFNLLDKYFDLVLFHCDQNFQTLAESFSEINQIPCEVKYTGFVCQPLPQKVSLELSNPLILVSIGGGRIGYELLNTIIDASELLASHIPHIIQIFTGPFMPEDKFINLLNKALNKPNIRLDRYTNNLMGYMQNADLSISLTGYNTTMNILQTKVRSLVVPIGHYSKDQEQLMRTRQLENLGIAQVLEPEKLTVTSLVEKILSCLQTNLNPQQLNFNLEGAKKTNFILQELLQKKLANVA